MKDTPLVKESRKKIEEEEKSPASSGIWTHHLLITRCVLYHCATTAATSFECYEQFSIALDTVHAEWRLFVKRDITRPRFELRYCHFVCQLSTRKLPVSTTMPLSSESLLINFNLKLWFLSSSSPLELSRKWVFLRLHFSKDSAVFELHEEICASCHFSPVWLPNTCLAISLD